MNVEDVRAIIFNRFGEVDQLREAVFKASTRRDSNPFSLWIFDCTQSITLSGFDLEAYQDELLRNEFYRVTGSLQWNLYCCFLCDEDRLSGLETNGAVTAIERDTTYARKFVRTPAMLQHDFESLSAIAKPSPSEHPQDIAAFWQRQLADNGLSVIYSGLSYSETVRRIKSGESVDEMESEVKTFQAQPEVRIDTIDAIDLDCFRQRPRQRQFEFAECNLIYGVNGAGKTSLLEGIEAWICGKHRRNKDIPVTSNCLKIKLNGSSEWQPGPLTNASLYRHRDHIWYGNYQARNNDLYSNFARFSFFDADAAARLEITDDDREIKRSLSDLVLGESATKIDERMGKILQILQTEEQESSRTIQNAHETKKAAQDANSSLQVPSETRRLAYEKLTEQLQSAGWRPELPQDTADGCLAVLAALNWLKARLDFLIADLFWLERPTISIVEKEQQNLAECNAGIQAIRQDILVLKKQQEEFAQKADVFGKRGELLQRCLEYNQIGATGLLDNARELERLKQQKKSLTTAASVLANIDITPFEGVAETGGDMVSRVRRDLDKYSKNAVTVRRMVASLESVHGRVETLLAEIRTRTKELLSAAPKTAACPVCGATYEEGELQKRLQHQEKHIATSELQQAHSELSTLQNQQERLNRLLQDLDALFSIGRDAMGFTSPAAEPISKLLSSIVFIERGIVQCDIDISRLDNDCGQMQAKGFNVDELQYLTGQLSRLSQDLTLRDETQLLQQLEKMTSEQKAATAQIDACAKALAEADEKTQALLGQYAVLGEATADTVTTRMAKLSGAKDCLEEIAQSLDIDASLPLTKVTVDIDALRQAVEGFIRLKQQEETVVHVIDENDKKIAALTDILERERPVLERLRKAINVLVNLQSEHSEEKYLEGFFFKNLQQISDLFCAMHAPRDFCNVVWEPNHSMAIRAVRKSTNAVCSVTELSSGQRNALALAIFLTMNSKIMQAPSLILLDDPVAHVDDLNIISFLDCLRELLSGYRRQVFFATASAKTAHLFKRKFDFLGDKRFRSFQLAP